MVPIGAVYRQTGMTVEKLRKWEARYGFPVPGRSASGPCLFQEPYVQAIASGLRPGTPTQVRHG